MTLLRYCEHCVMVQSKMDNERLGDIAEDQVNSKTPMVWTVEGRHEEQRYQGKICCRRCKLPPFRMIVTVFACFVIFVVCGIAYIPGNMLPYVTSYFRNVTGEAVDYKDTLWISNVCWLIVHVILPFIGLLERRMSSTLLMVIATLCNAIGLFGTYWAIQVSFALTVVFRGGIYSIMQAVFWPVSVKLAMKCFPKRKNFVGASVMMGYGAGTLVWNQVVTNWINPRNLQPDFADGEDFTAVKEMVDDEGSPDDDSSPDVDNNPDDASTPGDSTPDDSTPDYTPLDVLRSRASWTVWLMDLGIGLGITPFFSFHKAWAQTFIPDDHFLALVVSLSGVCSSVARPLWGLLADRIGIQTCIMVSHAVLVVSMATLVLTEFMGAASYLVWVCVIICGIAGYYCLMVPLVVAMFGPRSCTFATGIVYSAGAIYMLTNVFVAAAAKDAYGWHGIFFVSAFCFLLGLLLNASMRLDCGFPLPAQMKRHLFLSASARRNRIKAQGPKIKAPIQREKNLRKTMIF